MDREQSPIVLLGSLYLGGEVFSWLPVNDALSRRPKASPMLCLLCALTCNLLWAPLPTTQEREDRAKNAERFSIRSEITQQSGATATSLASILRNTWTKPWMEFVLALFAMAGAPGMSPTLSPQLPTPAPLVGLEAPRGLRGYRPTPPPPSSALAHLAGPQAGAARTPSRTSSRARLAPPPGRAVLGAAARHVLRRCRPLSGDAATCGPGSDYRACLVLGVRAGGPHSPGMGGRGRAGRTEGDYEQGTAAGRSRPQTRAAAA